MYRYRIILCTLALLAACSCKDSRDSSPQAESPTAGGDRDAHGCIGSAGYTWSAVLERCIRPFEEGKKLLPAKVPEDGSAILAAFAVFPPDSARAEVFLPQDGSPLVLERLEQPSGAPCWEAVSDRDAYSLRRDATGSWILEHQHDARRDTLFRSE